MSIIIKELLTSKVRYINRWHMSRVDFVCYLIVYLVANWLAIKDRSKPTDSFSNIYLYILLEYTRKK